MFSDLVNTYIDFEGHSIDLFTFEENHIENGDLISLFIAGHWTDLSIGESLRESL